MSANQEAREETASSSDRQRYPERRRPIHHDETDLSLVSIHRNEERYQQSDDDSRDRPNAEPLSFRPLSFGIHAHPLSVPLPLGKRRVTPSGRAEVLPVTAEALARDLGLGRARVDRGPAQAKEPELVRERYQVPVPARGPVPKVTEGCSLSERAHAILRTNP